ncbi:unnamed protein product [Owenia fusiformis]|uniref:Uncharacterized protein n=1 Tax=Owenia fusiformis TaxID=6347 RepID=A0A8J1UH03_OWEFU|nr:unnamed protein product [Owenia fusiformis]
MEDVYTEISEQLGMENNSKVSFQRFMNCRLQLGPANEDDSDAYCDKFEADLDRDLEGIEPPVRRKLQWPPVRANHEAENTRTESPRVWQEPVRANHEAENFRTESPRVWQEPVRANHEAENNRTESPRVWQAGSDNSLTRPESLDYDSGAQDLTHEPNSLYKLMQHHEPEIFQRFVSSPEDVGTTSMLDMANSLHLAALTSLKGEIIDLNNQLQLVTADKTLIEKQLNRTQSEKLRIQRECEDRTEEQSCRYEERIIELHSVIAELRKKIERHHISVIREEDEFEEGSEDNRGSADDALSANENNANDSRPGSSLGGLGGNDLTSALSRVVTELESTVDRSAHITRQQDVDSDDDIPDNVGDAGSIEEQAMQACREMEELRISPGVTCSEQCTYRQQLVTLEAENLGLQEQIGRQEADLNKFKAQIGSVREERDRLKRKVREMQTRIQSLEVSTSPFSSRTSTPTKSHVINPTTGERSSSSYSEQLPVAKIAELKKLKTGNIDRQVLGAEMSSTGLPNAKMAEHLAQNLQSNVHEIASQNGSEMTENKVQEFEIEVERLNSRIDHLKSQNDYLGITLEESKSHSNRLTELIGKYESNNTALQLAMNYSDHAIETYEVLIALLESDKGLLLANCRAAGIGNLPCDSSHNSEPTDVQSILHRAHSFKKMSENAARQVLQKLDRSCGVHNPGLVAQPWDDLSTTSRTASTASSTGSSADMESSFSKMDEQRLRDYVQQLKNDRSAVKLTVLELESVHLDPLQSPVGPTNHDTQRLDLENAVLMQELMAMKEEKAEYKAQNYLLDKENRSLQLRLNGKESQEQAYIVQIEHLKSEVEEQSDTGYKKDDIDFSTPSITLAELRSQTSSEIALDLQESLKREKKLKSRVHELVSTLEKLSKNSEIRHQQSAEFVSDLKRANSALVTAFEKAKKKYQSRVKKLEQQMKHTADKYETQMRLLKQRIMALEGDGCRPLANETSL